jgi:hypothetical protein
VRRRLLPRAMFIEAIAIAMLAAGALSRPVHAALPGRGTTRCGTLDLNRVSLENGNAYLLPFFATGGDGGPQGSISTVVLYEDSLPLGPARSIHNDIRLLGTGRFSHWGTGLYFSSSDNSDPRSNGRSYTWGVPVGATCPVQMCGTIEVAQAQPDSGFGYILLANFGFPGDGVGNPEGSSLRLYEGRQALGPAHSGDSDIRLQGTGRFSHWGNSLHFSTSDNSDPRSNGRSYYYGGNCRRLVDIHFTKLAANAPFYSTFNSNNQRIVERPDGLFVVHLTSMYPGPRWAQGNPFDTQSDWALLRSIDGGRTFHREYLGLRANTHVPPILDVDRAGNLYVFDQDFTSLTGGNVSILTFPPASGFQNPVKSTIPGMASDKFSAAYDQIRDQFYYASTGYGPGHPTRLATISSSRMTTVSGPVITQGSHAFLMYPLLRLDESSHLILAWTSQALPNVAPYLYWDIHFMVSPDRGTTWTTGEGVPLRTPVPADSDGPTDRVTLPDETGTHPWLASMLPRNGMLHFYYETHERIHRTHYARYNLATHRLDINHFPAFKGNSFEINGLGGYFVFRRDDPRGLIYFVGQNAGQGRMIVLASDDQGVTWFDYAASRERFTSIYSISGVRETGPSGSIYGVFTDLRTKDQSKNSNDVWFLSIKAE